MSPASGGVTGCAQILVSDSAVARRPWSTRPAGPGPMPPCRRPCRRRSARWSLPGRGSSPGPGSCSRPPAPTAHRRQVGDVAYPGLDATLHLLRIGERVPGRAHDAGSDGPLDQRQRAGQLRGDGQDLQPTPRALQVVVEQAGVGRDDGRGREGTRAVRIDERAFQMRLGSERQTRHPHRLRTPPRPPDLLRSTPDHRRRWRGSR